MENRNVILPINLVVTGLTISHSCALLSGFLSTGKFATPDIVLVVIFLIYMALLWASRMKSKQYYFIAMISSLFVYISQLGLFLISKEELMILVILATNFSILVFLFSAFQYRHSLLKDTEEHNSMNLLATYVLINGLSNIIYSGIVFQNPAWTSFIVPAASIITAIGIYSREKFFGLVCSFILILLPFIVHSNFFINNWNTVISIQIIATPLSIFIALLVMKNLFTKNVWENSNYYGASSYGGYGSGSSIHTVGKNCENCGKSVSIHASVGDSCPHCGVTWGRENQRYV